MVDNPTISEKEGSEHMPKIILEMVGRAWRQDEITALHRAGISMEAHVHPGTGTKRLIIDNELPPGCTLQCLLGPDATVERVEKF